MYLKVMLENLKFQEPLNKEAAREESLKVLKTLEAKGDIMLHSKNTHYMTVFKNVDAEYLYNFLTEEIDTVLDESNPPGLKHLEVSGGGVAVIMGDDLMFMFPLASQTVDCLDGFYEGKDYE